MNKWHGGNSYKFAFLKVMGGTYVVKWAEFLDQKFGN